MSKNPNPTERAPRSLPTLIELFEKTPGGFDMFSAGLTPRERQAFRGWLTGLRAQPQTISPAIYTLEDIHATWSAATSYAKGQTHKGKPLFSQQDWVKSLGS